MRLHARRSILLALLALTVLTPLVAVTPADRGDLAVDLEAILPASPDGWKQITTSALPSQSEIGRSHQAVYEHVSGGRLALTVAFSPDQRRAYELHLPDVCHRVRGDEIRAYRQNRVEFEAGQDLLVRHFSWREDATLIEADTWYWMVVDGRPVSSLFDLRWRQFKATMLGHPQSGLLVRIDLFGSQQAGLQHGRSFVPSFLRHWYQELRPEQQFQVFGVSST